MKLSSSLLDLQMSARSLLRPVSVFLHLVLPPYSAPRNYVQAHGVRENLGVDTLINNKWGEV
ncbi:hypothetical protein GcM3_00641 [Golovinomyces cichoracearum]|uniref:Uncharacterized protein n=1 Tax=Golovinomyces cichoracearum TaxID=62708 RepID=A0A420H6U5_9PEZI|nr:hypothetical protein GcM3_00641 [Golovinomyces cichoracearum]